jgi:hypothetical protein
LQADRDEKWKVYLVGRPHQVCYKIATADVEEHLVTIGQELCQVEAELAQRAPESETLDLIRRVLEEQYEQQSDGTVVLRPPEEVSASSLQSPHDPEATYRVKGGKSYRGGYVVNVSETADPQNSIQLITDVQVEANQTDDATLLEQSLDDQTERGIQIDKATVDGGYTGPQAEAACQRHQVELRATRMRGGHSHPDKWGWDRYTWQMDEDGVPVCVTCPQGVSAQLLPGRAEGRFIARFQTEQCANCPLLGQACRVRECAHLDPSLYVQRRAIQVAQQRQQLHPEDTPIRVVIEATVRSLKWPFPNSKLPVRGLIRVRMTIYTAALMVNLRRLHRHSRRKAKKTAQHAAFSLSSLKTWLGTGLKRVHRCFSMILPVIEARQTVTWPS